VTSADTPAEIAPGVQQRLSHRKKHESPCLGGNHSTSGLGSQRTCSRSLAQQTRIRIFSQDISNARHTLRRGGISRGPPTARGKYTSAPAAEGAIVDAGRFLVQTTCEQHETREEALLVRVGPECQRQMQTRSRSCTSTITCSCSMSFSQCWNDADDEAMKRRRTWPFRFSEMSSSGTCHDPAAGHRESQHQRPEDRSSALSGNLLQLHSTIKHARNQKEFFSRHDYHRCGECRWRP
jgi:hypothetical protein